VASSPHSLADPWKYIQNFLLHNKIHDQYKEYKFLNVKITNLKLNEDEIKGNITEFYSVEKQLQSQLADIRIQILWKLFSTYKNKLFSHTLTVQTISIALLFGLSSTTLVASVPILLAISQITPETTFGIQKLTKFKELFNKDDNSFISSCKRYVEKEFKLPDSSQFTQFLKPFWEDNFEKVTFDDVEEVLKTLTKDQALDDLKTLRENKTKLKSQLQHIAGRSDDEKKKISDLKVKKDNIDTQLKLSEKRLRELINKDGKQTLLQIFLDIFNITSSNYKKNCLVSTDKTDLIKRKWDIFLTAKIDTMETVLTTNKLSILRAIQKYKKFSIDEVVILNKEGEESNTEFKYKEGNTGKVVKVNPETCVIDVRFELTDTDIKQVTNSYDVSQIDKLYKKGDKVTFKDGCYEKYKNDAIHPATLTGYGVVTNVSNSDNHKMTSKLGETFDNSILVVVMFSTDKKSFTFECNIKHINKVLEEDGEESLIMSEFKYWNRFKKKCMEKLTRDLTSLSIAGSGCVTFEEFLNKANASQHETSPTKLPIEITVRDLLIVDNIENPNTYIDFNSEPDDVSKFTKAILRKKKSCFLNYLYFDPSTRGFKQEKTKVIDYCGILLKRLELENSDAQ